VHRAETAHELWPCVRRARPLPVSALESALPSLSPARSRVRPTYCSWFVTAQKNLHRPVLVDLWANTETLRSCEPASPTSRRSAPRAATGRRLLEPLSWCSALLCLPVSPPPGILLKPGHLSRRPFKIRSTRLYEREAKEKASKQKERNRAEFRNS